MSRANSPFTVVKDGVRVALLVSPRASRNRILGIAADADGGARLKVAVTAPPEDGKANRAVIALLAKSWRVPKTRLSIATGAGARRKLLHVDIGGAGDEKELMQRINDLAHGG